MLRAGSVARSLIAASGHAAKRAHKLPLQNAWSSQQARALNGLSIGVVKEHEANEKRVVITPTNVEQLLKKGAKVQVQQGAGVLSGFTDEQFEAAGASIVAEGDVWKSDVVLKINKPSDEQVASLENRHIIGMLQPRQDPSITTKLAGQGATAMSLDMLLRTLSRGQTFDVLSSQANMSGYKAVLEASNTLTRPLAGQTTAAGRLSPSKVMVVGVGVAGLAAIQQAKNMNAVVTAFDVRSSSKEQVEAMGAKFLEVDFNESGDGGGGYAKEMSKEWHAAAQKMLLEECKTTNVIITTALIPGKKAPIMITKEMVANMPPGSVTVDLAIENGGNVETSKAGEVFVTDNGVSCVGHLNMPSRMAATSSTLFGNNVTKLLLSMDYDGEFKVNHEDAAVRSMLIVDKGEVISPYEPPPSAPKPEKGAAMVSKEDVDPQTTMINEAMMGTGLVAGGLGLGSCMPDAGMLATLALSVWVGSQSVKGVAHALHSPLMSITNAISGMTIIGGMLQLGGGIVPYSMPQALATSAVALSAVNISGGFMVTNKMLNMFRRPTDPPEYFHYYLIPAGVATSAFGAAALSGACPTNLIPSMGLASGLACIGAISSMSNQQTARAAPALAAGGIGMGFATALASMNVPGAVLGQLAIFGAGGAYAGRHIANQITPTELPQAVAGFHSLVGIAASATAIGDFMTHDLAALDGFHLSSIYAGSWMGAITATGSVIAWGKLSERMDSKPLALPGRDYMNLGMAAASVGGLYGFATTKDPSTAGTCLALGTASSGLLGLHMTASIGGADMPVVITLLNSYSGWALCAEGFILDAPVLTVVGALIGSSGAFLTKIMCDGMNRSLPNVILGGFGTEAGAVQTSEGLVHTEINSEESAQALIDAGRVLIVPGYGMAVGQAQGVTAEITKILTDNGKTVNFAVHPVAGRMPGQLNVLLAEAGVPYEQVHEMEDINEEMDTYDVTMVIGANDTVNSNAEDDPTCDIAGMPVIQVWNSTQVIFMKRSMASGYAGVDNPVFYKDNTDMLLGNAKDTCEGILRKLKETYN